MKINKYNATIVLCMVLYLPPSIISGTDGGLLKAMLYLYPIYVRPVVSVTLIYIGICFIGFNGRSVKGGNGAPIIFRPEIVVAMGVIFLLLSLIPYVTSFLSLCRIEARENITRYNVTKKAVDNNIAANGRISVARSLFNTEGVIVKYLDNNNTLVNYEPSLDDVSIYEKRRPELVHVKYVRRSAKLHFVGSMSLLGLYSIFLAWSGYRTRKRGPSF